MIPRSFWFSAAAGLLVAASAPALDLGGLSKGMNMFNKAKEAKSTLDDAGKLVSGIGPEEERDLGQTVALEIIGRFGGLVREEEIMHRVNLVGRSLTRYSNRPDHKWRFAVLNSDTVNAFSAPDGYVFITRGLYQTVNNDDELAAVLGHEISHITGRHALKILELGEKGSVLAKQISKRSGDMRQTEAYLNQLGGNTEKIVKFFVEKGYDHPTEFEADLHGHDLAAVTGYAPGGLRAVLQALRAKGDDSTRIFSTHPPLAERIKRLPDEPAPQT